MTTIYVPRLIESAEQAEALPLGTVSIDLDSQGQPRQASIRVRCGWYCTGEVAADGSPWLAPHDAMAGDTALVPVEAEEVRVIASGGLERDYNGASVLNHTPDVSPCDYRRTEFHTPWEAV